MFLVPSCFKKKIPSCCARTETGPASLLTTECWNELGMVHRSGSSVKQLAQKYFGAPGADEHEQAAVLGSPEGSAEGAYTFHNARGTGPLTGSTPGTFTSQVRCIDCGQLSCGRA